MITAYVICLVLYFVLDFLLRREKFQKKFFFEAKSVLLSLLLCLSVATIIFYTKRWLGIIFLVVSLIVAFVLHLRNEEIEHNKNASSNAPIE